MAQSDTSTAVALPYGEAERQAAEVEAMKRMLDASRECFSLSMAVCNSPALRDYVIGRVRESFPDVRVVSVPKQSVDVFGAVADEVADSACAALFVVELERSIDSDQKDHPALRSLNASRGLWEQRFACPVVFWLPEYAARLTSIDALDFWRYLSHRFEFVAEQAGAVAAMSERFSGELTAAANLSADEKRFRIAELEARIRDAGESPPESLAKHVSVWLNELAFLCSFVGDLDQAEQMHRKSLEIDEKLGRLEGVATSYGNLGLIYRTRGDLDRAEEMLRKSLEIHENLGRSEGMTRDYSNLGVISQAKGNLDRAEQMHRKSLEINEKLGLLEGMAIQFANLGLISQARGDLDGAEQMHRKSLEINEELGHFEGMAGDYGNLGAICQKRGDLDGAEQMYRKSLEIDEKLGNLEGMAIEYANLGLIPKKRGDVALARRLWTRSRDLFNRVGAADQVEQLQGWLDGLSREGEA